MRAAAILAGALVAIGGYLYLASVLAAPASVIGIGSLVIAVTASLAAVAVAPSRSRARA